MESPLISAESHTTNNIVYLDKAGKMDPAAYKTDIVRPALKICDMWSPSAENIIVGTALAESGLRYVKQFKGGPALSWLQIEPATYNDTIRYLNTRQTKIRDKILAACYLETFPEASALIWNLRLSILIARTIYWMAPDPLPHSESVEAMAEYYIKYYHRSNKAKAANYIYAWENQ